EGQRKAEQEVVLRQRHAVVGAPFGERGPGVGAEEQVGAEQQADDGGEHVQKGAALWAELLIGVRKLAVQARVRFGRGGSALESLQATAVAQARQAGRAVLDAATVPVIMVAPAPPTTAAHMPSPLSPVLRGEGLGVRGLCLLFRAKQQAM